MNMNVEKIYQVTSWMILTVVLLALWVAGLLIFEVPSWIFLAWVPWTGIYIFLLVIALHVIVRYQLIQRQTLLFCVPSPPHPVIPVTSSEGTVPPSREVAILHPHPSSTTRETDAELPLAVIEGDYRVERYP